MIDVVTMATPFHGHCVKRDTRRGRGKRPIGRRGRGDNNASPPGVKCLLSARQSPAFGQTTRPVISPSASTARFGVSRSSLTQRVVCCSCGS